MEMYSLRWLIFSHLQDARRIEPIKTRLVLMSANKNLPVIRRFALVLQITANIN